MGYERYPRGTNPQGDYYGRTDPQDYGRDYGSGRDYGYSSARDYQAAGRDDDRQRGSGGADRHGRDRQTYGSREFGHQGYDRQDRDASSGGRDYDGGYDRDRGYGANPGYGERDRYGACAGTNDAGSREYHGSYGSGSRRFEDFGATKHADDDDYRGNRGGQAYGRDRQQGGYGRQPQGYDYDDRGFFARAGDEVRAWFGDEDAERRREQDSRIDEQRYDNDRDNDYHQWRRGQIQSLDRDYDEYRRENRTKFENEFGSWRTNRQGQRDSLNRVEEHMDVVGSDGEHVGTVDKVRGDRILLTKNDVDAGGRHHSIPSSWLTNVDGKVTLGKTAAEAKKAWRDEERNQAMFGDEDRSGRQQGGQWNRQSGTTGSATATGASSTVTGETTADTTGDKTLNKSFSGTY